MMVCSWASITNFVQWHQVGSVRLAMVGVLTPGNSTNGTRVVVVVVFSSPQIASY